MSLQSYEAIYDHGQVTWQGDAPQVEKARVIVTILATLRDSTTTAKHKPSVRIAGKGKIIGALFPRRHRLKTGTAQNDHPRHPHLGELDIER